MAEKLIPVTDTAPLKTALSSDMVANSGFLARVFHRKETFKIYSVEGTDAVVAIQDTGEHMVFSGDWTGLELPGELLPEKGVFVSCSPLSAVEMLKTHYELAGEWPCWLFLAPDGFGPGPWDEIGPIRPEEVPFIASHWELGGEDREEHIRDSVERFQSACLRIDGRPASWCGLHFQLREVADLGFAHTLEEHRRKGHQAQVTKALVNRLSAMGCRATADVIKDNAPSIASCKAMGFEIVGEKAWADFKARV